MIVEDAIRRGFSLARRSGTAVWVVFLANLGVAALAGLPIYRGILRFTGHSRMSQELLRGFPSDWLTDFAFNSSGSLDRYAEFIAYLGLLAILVNGVLAGGVLAQFRVPNCPQTLRDFVQDTRRYAWRMIRLVTLGLICYWIVFRLLNQALGHAVDRWTRELLDDRPVFWARLAVSVLTLIGLLLVNLVMDYARVRLVLEEGTGVVEAFLASLGFSLGRLPTACAVYAVPSLLGVALLGLYRLVMPWGMVNAALGGAGGGRFGEPLVLALLFTIQQAVMWGRYWCRVAAWASEWSLYFDTR